MEVHIAGRRAYLVGPDDPLLHGFKRKHAKALRKMLKHYMKVR